MLDCPILALLLLEHFELAHENFTLVGSVKCLADNELYIFELHVHIVSCEDQNDMMIIHLISVATFDFLHIMLRIMII